MRGIKLDVRRYNSKIAEKQKRAVKKTDSEKKALHWL